MPDCVHLERILCMRDNVQMIVPDAAEGELIGSYTFDDNMGLDSSGKGHHSSVVPRSGPGHGPTGNSARFDGVQLMEVAHSAMFDSIDLSISLWMYLMEDSTNSYRTIFRKAATPADMTPALMLLPNNRQLHVRLSTSENVVKGFDSIAVVPLRRWTHLAYVLKGGVTLTLYVNGIKDCPVLGSNGARCPPGGSAFMWDEGDVHFNNGPLYVGGDPFMPGTPMFVDNLKIYKRALSAHEVHLEAHGAQGAVPVQTLQLGCSRCTEVALQQVCVELENYHPCLCEELMSGGLNVARSMGWLRGSSTNWALHAVVQNPNACVFSQGPSSEERMGFCCVD